MSDGRLLHVISGDQGFLPAPVDTVDNARRFAAGNGHFIAVGHIDQDFTPFPRRQRQLPPTPGAISYR
jgi:hypothetical protein